MCACSTYFLLFVSSKRLCIVIILSSIDACSSNTKHEFRQAGKTCRGDGITGAPAAECFVLWLDCLENACVMFVFSQTYKWKAWLNNDISSLSTSRNHEHTIIIFAINFQVNEDIVTIFGCQQLKQKASEQLFNLANIFFTFRSIAQVGFLVRPGGHSPRPRCRRQVVNSGAVFSCLMLFTGAHS